jgi:hypothetical protein
VVDVLPLCEGGMGNELLKSNLVRHASCNLRKVPCTRGKNRFEFQGEIFLDRSRLEEPIRFVWL